MGQWVTTMTRPPNQLKAPTKGEARVDDSRWGPDGWGGGGYRFPGGGGGGGGATPYQVCPDVCVQK